MCEAQLNAARVIQVAEGQRYGRWQVVGKSGARQKYWMCRCDCGVVREVYGNSLSKGVSQSCGCLGAERTGDRARSHGESATPLYFVWAQMKRRCYRVGDNRYPQYGGRGIVVCDRWRKSFAAFLADMGYPPSGAHTLDRIDNDGNYEPGNVRWATLTEQANNRRSNHVLEHEGQRLSVVQWARATGLPEKTLYARLYAGWAVSRALTEPLNKPARSNAA